MNDIVIFQTGSGETAPAFNRPQSDQRAIAAGAIVLQMHG